ncbi:hypothetical protein RCL1_003219 [Eukaryota sp. TZLM3-RCL]
MTYLRFTAVARHLDRTLLGFHKVITDEPVISRCIELVTEITSKVDVSKRSQLRVVDNNEKGHAGAGALQFISDANFIYFAVFEPDYRTRVGESFLQEFSSFFLRECPNASSATPGSLNKQVKNTTMKIKDKYQNPERLDAILAAQSEVDSSTKALQSSINTLVERTGNLDGLVTRGDILVSQASSFSQNANTLKRIIWWRNCKLTIILSVFVVAVLAYIALFYLE